MSSKRMFEDGSATTRRFVAASAQLGVELDAVLAASIAASWSTMSSMTLLWRACPGAVAPPLSLCIATWSPPPLATLSGTKGPLDGSNPGAMRRRASRFRRSFSSSRCRRYASCRALCDANVDFREASRVRTCCSSVKGYTNWPRYYQLSRR